jgi:hypothetical protein
MIYHGYGAVNGYQRSQLFILFLTSCGRGRGYGKPAEMNSYNFFTFLPACGPKVEASTIPSMALHAKFIGCFLVAVLALNICGCANMHLWPPGLTAEQRRQLRAMPLAVKPWPDGPAKGRILHTTHYRIYTTIDNPLQQRLIARVLEADYARFLRLVPNAAPKLPMVGYVFRNRRQWALYTHKVMGPQASIYLHIETGGYEGNGVFATYRSNVAEVLSVVAHEAWHQFSFLTLKNHLPAWLDEGLATQCEAMQWHNGYPVFIPWLNVPRWEMLRQAVRYRQLLPLPVLAGTQAGNVVQHKLTYVHAYYAEVWSLLLFIEHSRYKPALMRLLAMARKGQLNSLLAGTGLTAKEENNLTLRWNHVAGEIYLQHFFRNRPGLKHHYVVFIDHLVQHWPPERPKSAPPTATLSQGQSP